MVPAAGLEPARLAAGDFESTLHKVIDLQKQEIILATKLAMQII